MPDDAPGGDPVPVPAAAPAATGWRRRLGGVVSALGAGLAGLSLFFAVVLFGGAISQGDPGGGVFVLLFGLVPTAIGVGLAHLGTPGYWRRPVHVPHDLWRRPGMIGIAI